MKNKSHIQKIISLLTSSSILFTSCGGDNLISIFNQDEKFNFNRDKFATNTESIELIPLDIYLSEKDIKEITFIHKFSKDIIKNPELVSNFIANPNSILSQYNINDIEIDLNSEEIQLLIALGDKDIHKAIQAKDLKTFLFLLQKKGLLQNDIIEGMTQITTNYNKGKITTRSGDDNGEQFDENIWPIAICALGVGIYVVGITCFWLEVAAQAHFAVTGFEDDMPDDMDDDMDDDVDDDETNYSSTQRYIVNKILSDKAIKLFYNQNRTAYTYLNENEKKDMAQSINIILSFLNIKENNKDEIINFICNIYTANKNNHEN